MRILNALIIGLLLNSVLCGQESLKSGFSGLLEKEIRQTFAKVTDYIEKNPDANDLDQASQWLFSTALQYDLETEVLELASEYSKNPHSDATTRTLAKQVLTFGFAKSGKAKEAVEEFQSQLRFARRQSGGALIEYGRQIATELRMARKFAGAQKIYEEIANKFFLNPDVRKLCENKVAKLELIEETAPDFSATANDGSTITLGGLKGKVVLIDFWATFCPPCIEEFPNIKRLYADNHDKGFEIIGVSLDADKSIVDRFTEQSKMTWPQIVGSDDVQVLRDKYLVEKIPSLYIIDRAGKLHQYDVKGSNLRKVIKQLVRKKPQSEARTKN